MPVADSDTLITDPDNTTLTSAVVVLTNAQAGDSLSIAGALPTGISPNIDTSTPGQIKVTLSGSASLASYQTALGQLRFNNLAATPSTVNRILTATVNDGFANSNTATSTLQVVADNGPTQLTLNGPFVINEMGSVSLNGSFNDPGDRRDFFAENPRVRGLGYKEASHFLRNVGFRGYAILDKHVLSRLAEFGVIQDPKPPSTRRRYLELECQMKVFAARSGID